LSIQPGLLLARWVGMDHRLDPQRTQLAANRVGVVAGVGDQRFAARVVRDDALGDRRFVSLAGREFDVQRPPFGVDECVDLRGEPTPRVTESIADDPPFPPAASWWARTTEASRMTASSSRSS
jgi:hypothetical protein